MSLHEVTTLDSGEAIRINTTRTFCAYRIEGLVRVLRRHYVRHGADATICGVFVGGPEFAIADEVPADGWGCEERPCERCVRGLA